MGIMDKFSKMLGRKPAVETVKGPSTVLREAGIDPSDLKFSFGADKSIAVSGNAGSQAECDSICQALKEMPNIESVVNNITIGAPEPPPAPEAEPEVAAPAEPTTEPEATGRTYTVQAGDSLWKISEKMYGSGGKYMKIFEANTDLLENPDKIFPGQELVIPELDD
jgi:LysM repeat protein